MKFKKKNVLTCVNADKAKVGSMGWFADDLVSLKKNVATGEARLGRLCVVREPCREYRFVKTDENGWKLCFALFYPAKEK